jgi:hypothetical protein
VGWDVKNVDKREDRIAGKMGECIHFTGIMHPRCAAGVLYDEVVLSHEPIPYTSRGVTYTASRSTPCLAKYNYRGATCGQRSCCTREEAEAYIDELDKRAAEWLNNLANGICPTHNIPVTKEQVGHSVYAKECGCRLYQGTL